MGLCNCVSMEMRTMCCCNCNCRHRNYWENNCSHTVVVNHIYYPVEAKVELRYSREPRLNSHKERKVANLLKLGIW